MQHNVFTANTQCKNWPILNKNEVHIWRVALNTLSVEAAYPLLSPDEQARAARLRIESKRNQYIVARAALRTILSGYLTLTPDAVNFQYGPQGKPSIERTSDSTRLEFNLSHSGDWALIAVTDAVIVGIDIEEVRAQRDEEKLAQRYFSQAESTALMALPEDERTDAFFRCWACKEAFIKAVGEGLSYPLDSFDVALPPEEAGLLKVHGKPDEVKSWCLCELSTPTGYAAAVAVHNPNAVFIEFSFPAKD